MFFLNYSLKNIGLIRNLCNVGNIKGFWKGLCHLDQIFKGSLPGQNSGQGAWFITSHLKKFQAYRSNGLGFMAVLRFSLKGWQYG